MANQRFTGSLGATTLEGAVSHAYISCLGGEINGEVSGPTTVTDVVIDFTGCETSKLLCMSPGAPPAVIATNKLDGVIGNVTPTLPAIRLFGPGASGTEPKTSTIATIDCGNGIAVNTLTGSVIGALSGSFGMSVDEGKFTATHKLTFSETHGRQKYTTFLSGECGGLGNCGPEQLSAITNGTSELGGQGVIMTLKTVPFAGKLGFTK